MAKAFSIRLDCDDLGQLLDGLQMRRESWQKTADYLESGYVSDEAFICEECSDASEVAAIAHHFAKIISQIELQVEEQGGWR